MAVVLGSVKELAELLADMDPVEVAAQALLLAGQLPVLRFLADAGLDGQRPSFRSIVAVPALSGLAGRCTDLLTPY
jgi:hypothetical protein